MSNKNNVTGDTIITKYSEAYSNNFDLIFRKKIEPEPKVDVEYEQVEESTEVVDQEIN